MVTVIYVSISVFHHLLDVNERPKINYFLYGFFCALLPKTDFLFESNGDDLGENFIYLIISPSSYLLSDPGGG